MIYSYALGEPSGKRRVMLFEPGGLIVVPTVISSNNHIFPVQVINFSQEDVWLSPKTRLGILSQCQCVEGDP